MRLLLLDTCGENASIALAENGSVLHKTVLPPRAASAQLMRTIRSEMDVLQWPLRSLRGVGVVSGPGSFTGVRVGLAAAKGICEVTGLPLAAVSRLALLLAAGGEPADDLGVLDAGRGEFYVRTGTSEALLTYAELKQSVERAGAGRLLVTEAKLVETLAALQPVFVECSAANALRLFQERLSAGGDPVETVDANYVRSARALYPGRPQAAGHGV